MDTSPLSNRQVICVHAGQCGAQTSLAMWDTIRREYDLSLDGANESLLESTEVEMNPDSFYKESSAGKYQPRALIFDLDPLPIDAIHASQFKQMFNRNFLCSGSEDAANCFARGRYVSGLQLIGKLRERLRFQLESCDSCVCLVHNNASSGGTGSGVLPDVLTAEDTKRTYTTVGIVVYASEGIDNGPAYYNTVFHMNAMNDLVDMNLHTDNEALYRNAMNSYSPPPGGVTYEDLNRQIALIASGVTCGDRVRNCQNFDLQRLRTCLVPYVGLSYVNATVAAYGEPGDRGACLKQLCEDSFGPFLSGSIDPKDGQYLGSYIILRGPKGYTREAYDGVQASARCKNFASWIPCRVSLGYCPKAAPRESGIYDLGLSNLVNFFNNSAVANTFEMYGRWFGVSYSKRSFVHWYLEHGMQEFEFAEALGSLDLIRRVYKSVGGLEAKKD